MVLSAAVLEFSTWSWFSGPGGHERGICIVEVPALTLPQSHSTYQHRKPRGASGWTTSWAPSCCFHHVCQYHGLCNMYDAVPTRWSQVSDNSFTKIQSFGCVMVCGLDIGLKSNFLMKKPGISLKLHWDCIQHINLHLPNYKFTYSSTQKQSQVPLRGVRAEATPSRSISDSEVKEEGKEERVFRGTRKRGPPPTSRCSGETSSKKGPLWSTHFLRLA